jgi:hypothetical protein
MLIVDMSAIKLPGEAKQNNLPPECGQPIDTGDLSCWKNLSMAKAQDAKIDWSI